MSNDSFEPPWNGNGPLLREHFPDNLVISDAIYELELLLQQRKKLSCPNDDIDNRILMAIGYVLDSIKNLTEQQELTDTQKRLLIKNSRSLIKKANDIIEKTMKIRPYHINS